MLAARGEPVPIADPDPWWRAAEAVRAALRASVRGRPDDQRALVPALVVGDDARMDAGLVDDFRTTGLTHLTAVSGTNLTLLVGFVLVLARWLGVRGRGLRAVALLGIGGFLLLARAEPSVVRAAAMGTVALVGLGSNGLQRGTRALGVAVVVLLLTDPWLASSVGFALSVLATAGILLLAPPWRDALARWLPRWVAEAIAVPAAAQLACTPVVAAISGQVSLVAVVANLVVAPAVAPATVLGLGAALTGVLWGPRGRGAGHGRVLVRRLDRAGRARRCRAARGGGRLGCRPPGPGRAHRALRGRRLAGAAGAAAPGRRPGGKRPRWWSAW